MPDFLFTIIETTTRTIRVNVSAENEIRARAKATVGSIKSRMDKEGFIVLSDETKTEENVVSH